MSPKAGIRLIHFLFFLGCAWFAAAAAAGFLVRPLCSYDAIHRVLEASSNRAAADFFTLDYYEGVVVRARLAGFYLALSALALAIGWRWLSRRRGEWISPRPVGANRVSAGRFLRQALIADRMVFCILAAAVVLRLLYLFQPASSDEVRGYYAWTARPFLLAISDFRAPQHLLYTILDYPVVRLFGNAEWSIRLPAFIGGILMPVLVFGAGRKWFGRSAGLLAACFVAANPILVHYSVNGRAYTIHACMVLLLWISAMALAGEPFRLRWSALLVLSGVAGLMALPTMIYSLVGTYLWLLLAHLSDRGRDWKSRGKSVFRLAGCGAATVWLGGLAYLPAFVASDQWYSVDAGEVSGVVPWGEIPARMAGFLRGAFRVWNLDIPAPAVVLLSILFVAGVAAVWRKKAFSLLVANLLGAIGVLLVLRIIPYSRAILYLCLVYWMAIGAGLAALVDFVSRRLGKGSPAAAANLAAVLVALALSANLLVHNREGFTAAAGQLAPGIREAMGYLKDHARPGDHIVCAMPAAGPVYYYHLRAGMDCRLWFAYDENPPADILAGPPSVYFVINTYDGQSLRHIRDLCNWGAATPALERFEAVHSNRHAVVYRYLGG